MEMVGNEYNMVTAQMVGDIKWGTRVRIKRKL